MNWKDDGKVGCKVAPLFGLTYFPSQNTPSTDLFKALHPIVLAHCFITSFQALQHLLHPEHLRIGRGQHFVQHPTPSNCLELQEMAR